MEVVYTTALPEGVEVKMGKYVFIGMKRCVAYNGEKAV